VSGAPRLRVVTYNIHGGRPARGRVDLQATAAALSALQADLVALQEVHRFLLPPGVFQDQPRLLGKLLGLEARFGRCFGHGPCGYGNALLLRVPLLRLECLPLPGRGEPRALLEAEVDWHGSPVRFLNSHFSLEAESRKLQARRVAERVGTGSLPLILAGDLNAAPDSDEVRLLEAAGLRHAVPTELLSAPACEPRWRIDYLMVSRHFHVERGFVPATEASDHLPLAADILLSGARAKRF